MNLNNIELISTEELIEQFKEATRRGRPPQALINEMKKRPGIALINATDSIEVTMEKAYTAIKQVESGEAQNYQL